MDGLCKVRMMARLTCLVWLLSLPGCGVKLNLPRSILPPQRLEQLDLLVPKQIEILPFTKARSFDEDRFPDGVQVVLAVTDRFGDHVKAVGQYRFELYSFRPASGDPKGQRLGIWELPVRTVEDHRRHWDPFSQTYGFRLLWHRALQPNQRYVLQVTYFGANDKRLFDEYVFDFRVPRTLRREMRSEAGRGT